MPVMYLAGKAIEVADDQVQAALDQGYSLEGAEQHAQRLTAEQREADHGGVKGKVAATLLAVPRGISFGASDYILDQASGGANNIDAIREQNPGLSLGAELVGGLATLPIGGAARLGGAAKIAGEAKAATAARELAVASDVLGAEHVASSLSLKGLVGTGGELSASERALGRAGRALDEATIARQGLTDVPADLIGMDARALKEAAAQERLAMRASVDAEKVALEEARKPLRAKLADEVKELHLALEAEAPIFKAVKGADVQKIEGMKTASAQLAKSYSGLRSALDNPLKVIENTDLLKGHLQMRQAALEVIQSKGNELRAVLGTDARAAGLAHVDEALDMTRMQIARIGEVSKATPVASEKLAALSSGISPRLTSIENAIEALKVAPEVGLAEKGIAAGATMIEHQIAGLARAIPGVGIAAPFVGKYAAQAIGKAFEHLAAGKALSAEKSAAALKAFLGAGAAAAPRAALTATAVLSAASFGPSSSSPSPETGKSAGLVGAFRARAGELRQQTMIDPASGRVVVRPETRAQVAAQLAPVKAVNPVLADHLESIAVAKLEYLASVMPRRPEVGGLQIGPDTWRPSSLEMRSWARTVRAVEDPGSVEDDLARGVITPEAAAAYRAVYPERFAAMQSAIFEAAPQLAKTLPLKKKIALSVFTGIPLIPALQPNILGILQASFAMEQGSGGGMAAPQPAPQFSAFGSTPSKEKTAAQRSEEP